MCNNSQGYYQVQRVHNIVTAGEWSQVSPLVDRGKTRKFEHNCGDGKPLSVTRGEDGMLKAFCHRCGTRAAHDDGRGVLYTAPPAPSGVTPVYETALTNPEDFPHWARVWLTTCGVPPRLAEQKGVRFCDTTQRIILPWWDHHGSLHFQARGSPGSKVKYLTYTAAGQLPQYQGVGELRGVVVTEDIVSAMRVGMVPGYCGIALMGTALPKNSARQLLRSDYRGKVFVWLDPDKAGRDGTAALRPRLHREGMLTVGTFEAYTRKEPKEYWHYNLRAALDTIFSK
jgi:hypothetical protein